MEKEQAVPAKEKELEKQFLTWVKNENATAMKEMESSGFTQGFFKFIVQVPYGLNKIDNASLLEIAQKSECHNTGWPIGVVLSKPEYKPVSIADGIRAVIKSRKSFFSKEEEYEFDYWAMNNRGHFFFVRSHQEDTSNSQKAEKESRWLWFDIVIWRISEIFCYTSNLCTDLNLKQSDKIKLTLSYEGLRGRDLRVSSTRRAPFVAAKECTEDKYEKDLELQVIDVMPKLKEHVYQIAKELFGLFDFYKPDRAVVDSIVDEFLNARR